MRRAATGRVAAVVRAAWVLGVRWSAGSVGLVLVAGVASGAVLYVKEVSETSIHGLTALQAAGTELRTQDGLEWRAVSGRVPFEQIGAEAEASTSRMRGFTVTAMDNGLDREHAARLRAAQDRYVALVRQELSLVAQGRMPEAEELGESQVDAAFVAVQAELARAAGQLTERSDVMEWVSNAGILLTIGISLGMTARIQRRRRLAEARRAAERVSEARYRALIDQSSDVVLVTDRSGRVSYRSPAADRLLGDQEAPGPTGHLTDVLHPDDLPALLAVLSATTGQAAGDVTVDARLGTAESGWRNFELSVRDLTQESGVAGIVLTGRDVTDRHTLQREMTHRALHDALTGLPNRALLAECFEQALRSSRRDPDAAGTGLLLIDLDRFKDINDTLGHHIGDDLLTQVGPRLAGVLRDVDTVARLGGDEFAVLLPGARTIQDVVSVARALLSVLVAPYRVQELDLHVEASIGVVLSGTHGEDAQTLLQRADVAMYVAKTQHLGVSVYHAASDEHSPQRLALLADLRRALDNDELVLHYQPQISINTGEVCGAEALVRWNHPTRGQLAPDAFIPLAEHTGLIGPLTHRVLDMALAQARRWLTAGQALQVSVNLSARNLLDDHLDAHVAELLRSHGVPAELLVLEVTESAIMTDPTRATQTLQRLHDLGIRISIDDFGAGYTSLRQLKNLPVDELKVDRSFVMTMTDDRGDQIIVHSLVDLGHNLGLATVAEGVETADALTTLTGYGCDIAQGFHFSRPLPADEFDRWRVGRASTARPVPPAQRRSRAQAPRTT